MADDYTDNTSTTGTVRASGSATGEIESSGDRDWFAVELVTGRTYRFDLEGSATGAGTLWDPVIHGIFDSDGALIGYSGDDDSGAGKNSLKMFTPTESGTHYVSAGSWVNHLGTYRLSVTVTDDFAAGAITSGAVAVGGLAAGEIESSGDRDWFAVELTAGRTYRIDLEGTATGVGSLWDPAIHGIHDSDGALIGYSGDDDGGTGKNSQKLFTATESGTHYVSAGSWGNQLGTYRLAVAVIDDFAADTGTTGTVTVGGSVTGDIETPCDRDWFAVELEEGATYQVDLEAWGSFAGTLRDAYLRGIYDSHGNRLPNSTDDDGGHLWNSRLSFTAPESGTWYVSAGGKGDRTGTYTLSVTDTAVDVFAADTSTTGAVRVGGSVTSALDFGGDMDWFAVDLEAGKSYQFDLKGSGTGDGTLPNPTLQGIHDSDGDRIPGTIDYDGGAGANSRVIFTPMQSGTYYASASSGSAAGSGKGTYTLSVAEVEPDDDFRSDTDTTGTVTVGGSATGEIDYSGDRDWFAVELEAGKTYRFDLKGWSTDDGTLDSSYLYGIHDSDGNAIADTTDNSSGTGYNSRVSFAPTEGGTYYVSAGGHENFIGTYTLSVEEVL